MDSEQFQLVVSLREHFESRISALERAQKDATTAFEKLLEVRREAIQTRLASYEKAVDVARESMDERLKGMNEFRSALKDQAATFITRDELGLVIRRLEQDIRNLEAAKASLLSYVTREEMDSNLAGVNGAVRNLELSKATIDGKASQSQVFWALGVSVVGLVLAAVTLVTRYAPGQ